MTKRVCLVGPAYPYRGGIAHFTSTLAKEFGRECDVLVINFKRLYPSFLFPGKTQYDESAEPLDIESMRIIDSLNPISFWRAARAIKAFLPDLVVFQWWQPFFAVAFATMLLFLGAAIRRRVVFLCHNVLPHESSFIDKALIRVGFGQVARFLVQSQEDKRNLQSLKNGAVVQVNPHPIYDTFKLDRWTRESSRQDLAIDGRVVLFFGLIRPYKGLHVLLRAFAKSLDQIDATLLVVGEFYEDKDPYLSEVRSLGIEANVRIVDEYVPNEAVEKYFLAADVVVLPYLSATQSGIAQIAFAFDKPIVVTDVGGLPDVVEDGVTGFVVPVNDPKALCGAITRIFDEDPSELAAAVARAKARFSWERCCEVLWEIAATPR